ncbi:hypothetical protein GE061_010860 [Apolygus lucorum]|uniref:Uncharacterized protein n=1 Tax=Apolygus lucorum TaxID=248454 RepID=A0A8S9XZX5_APOLU|nr:hypothetical protein GE061_010860 [Apolygus lucorum]
MSQQNESAVSERLGQTTDSQVLSSDLELRALSPALTVDARFYNLIDQIKSMSAAANLSNDSFHCGVAQSSPPSSEEDADLPQLPREPTEVLNVADNKRNFGRTGSLVKTELKPVDVNIKRDLNSKAQPQNGTEQQWIGKSPAIGVNILADGNRHMTTLQLAKFKLAQEAIQSMVNNVNEVLASIDSESDLNIVSPSGCENKEVQPFSVHLEGDGNMDEHLLDSAISHNDKPIVQKTNHDMTTPIASTSGKCDITHSNTNRRIYKNQLAPKVADNQAGPPSFSSNESRIRPPRTSISLNQTISRERKFFVLDSSNSNSSVFTEKLRQSLAQETSSPNLSTVLTTEEFTNQSSCEVTRTGSSKKPLKRRSWVPSSK